MPRGATATQRCGPARGGGRRSKLLGCARSPRVRGRRPAGCDRRPGPAQRWRIRVDRRGRDRRQGMAHAVDHRWSEVEGLASAESALNGWAGEHQALFDHAALDHHDAGGRLVVIVEPGVGVLRPADRPGVDALVRPDRRVRTRSPRRRDDHELAPPSRRVCKPPGEADQFGGTEGAGRVTRCAHAAAAAPVEEPSGVLAQQDLGASARERLDHRTVGAVREAAWSAHATSHCLNRHRTVGRGVVEALKAARGRGPPGPPRAASRSLSNGAPPALSIAKTTRSLGYARRATAAERQPGRLHLRDVARQRRPPQRIGERGLLGS